MQPQTRRSRLNMMAFCLEHPKWDQKPKFTPLSETTSIPTPFTCGVSPPPLGEKQTLRWKCVIENKNTYSSRN